MYSYRDELANSLIHRFCFQYNFKVNIQWGQQEQKQKQKSFINQVPIQRTIYLFSSTFHNAHILVRVWSCMFSEDWLWAFYQEKTK